jgi:carbohydrate kinase (thermoresistant glucokinase family)
MPHVPGLRSPYSKVGRLVYFGRMLDKIRLHAVGKLPADYHENLGAGKPVFFDARCCRFLGVAYEDVVARVKAGGSDLQILQWAEARGIPRSDEDCHIWNHFMMKIGWRDDRSAVLKQRVEIFGLAGKCIETGFDFLDYDEGRDPQRTRPWELRANSVILLMGVAGSGKSTVGELLAKALGWQFKDADEFHPPENIAKMSSGIPLTDEDRKPWLDAIRRHIEACRERQENAVLTCSALKERYRSALGVEEPDVRLVYLRGTREVLRERINQRVNHFMKPEMLDSQLAALEEPVTAFTLDVSAGPEQLVQAIRREFEV